MQPRVLVIEDEEAISELVSYNLRKEGFEVSGVFSGESGLARAREEKPNLVVLDLMLPGVDGLEVCRELKSKPATKDIPIMMISARGEEGDIVRGLEMGADDYVTKPFSPRILVARTKAILRRSVEGAIDERDSLTVHELSICPGRFEVKARGKIISLTATEFKILHYLARHPGWVFTRYQIVDAVKGDDYAVTERSVDVQIVSIRRKLESLADYIETVRGVGYRFKE